MSITEPNPQVPHPPLPWALCSSALQQGWRCENAQELDQNISQSLPMISYTNIPLDSCLSILKPPMVTAQGLPCWIKPGFHPVSWGLQHLPGRQHNFITFFFFNFSPEILRPNPWEAWLVLLPMGLREKTWNKKQFPSWSVLQILHVPSSSHSWKSSLCSWKWWYLEFFYHESFLDLQRTKCYLIWPECHCSPALLQLWLPLSPGPSAFPAMDFEPPFLEIPISINQHSWVFLHRCNSLKPQQEEKLCQLWL